MKFIEYTDAEQFLAILEHNFPLPWENDLMIGLVNQLIKDPSFFDTNARLFIVKEKDEVKLVSFLTHPWPIIVYADSSNEDHISFFADSLFEKIPSLNGINARKDIANIFAMHWCKRTGKNVQHVMEMKLFYIKELQNVHACKGSMILANDQHKELMIDWSRRFHKEVPIGNDSLDHIRSHVEHIIASGNGFIWIDREPVCMVFRERPTKNGFSIGYVYTPHRYRNEGYASNLVYDVCKKFLTNGFSYATLFADVQNPTSNKIYKNIGFQEICRYQIFHFL